MGVVVCDSLALLSLLSRRVWLFFLLRIVWTDGDSVDSHTARTDNGRGSVKEVLTFERRWPLRRIVCSLHVRVPRGGLSAVPLYIRLVELDVDQDFLNLTATSGE